MRALDRLLAADPALRALHDAVRARMAADPAHDLAHLARVAEWTLRLLPGAYEEAGLPAPRGAERLAVAAALLHDVVNVPKSDPRRAEASRLSADAARALLPAHGFAPDEIALVADAILDHSYSRGAVPATPLGRALQDADRLEALGALGVMRCVATGALGGAGFVHPDDPWAQARALDERGWAVDHFQTKLLRLPPTLCTRAGRREAARRARPMVDFLRQLGDELGVPYAGLEPEAPEE